MTAREIQVTIGSVSFNTAIMAPGPLMYLLTSTEEILDALGTRRSDTPKQGEHGSEDSLSEFEPRVLHFQGELHAITQAERVVMEQNLDFAVSLSRSQSFDGDDGYKLIEIVDEDGVNKQVFAKIIEMPKYRVIENGSPEDRFFEFTMFAADPAVYAQTLSSETGPESYYTTTFTFQDGVSVTFQDGDLPTFQDAVGNVLEVTNTGNFASPPLITITGPAVNPVITNTTSGKKIAFTRNGGLTMDEDDTLVINVAAYTAVLNSDTNVRSNISLDSEWFDILPGLNEITLFDDTPADLSDQMELDFRASWI